MRNLLLTLIILINLNSISYNQKNILQIDLSGGLNVPTGAMRNTFMFASNGYHLGSHIDFFMGHLGLGVAAGYVRNSSSDLFTQHIERKYLETMSMNTAQSWQTKYMVFGPTFRMGLKKWDINIFAKAGISQVEAPKLMFEKAFFDQPYEVFKFTGQSGDFQYIWNAGLRSIYNLNSWLGLQVKVDYLSTHFFSQMGYSYNYFNVQDINNNGIIDDPEYKESEEIYKSGDVSLSSLNASTGIVVKIGRITGKKKVALLPADVYQEALSLQKDIFVENTPEINIETPIEIPIVEKAQTPPLSEDIEQPLEEIHVVEAPESQYDSEAAEFLYKAGESYFASNNFDEAIACFNKLKSDVHYPRAKYMFALSQCAIGNCAGAQKEYKEFAKTYKESDSRTLEVIFASHLERCKKGDLLVKNNPSENTGIQKAPEAKEYRVQFVAIRKSDATFPKVAQIGPIVTEFFPNKTLYRYTLEGYSSLDLALQDMKEVRRLGFKDAFIAIYENGTRTKTLYHAKLR